MRKNLLILAMVASGLAMAGCGGSGDTRLAQDEAEVAGQSTEDTGGGRSACGLLSNEEVAALTGTARIASEESESSDRYSTCDYTDSDSGFFAFSMTVYWYGGGEDWAAWRSANGIAADLFEDQQNVDIHQIVEQGPVTGVGDAAYFSGLLPSLVLKDDILFELNLVLVPDAEAKFRGLAETLLSRI